MNFYNPYYMAYPYMMQAPRVGLFSRLVSGFNFSSFLNGTQRTLNIVNQTIPLVKQAQPLVKNAKTMFKVMSEFNKVNRPTKAISKVVADKPVIQDNNPTFFA